MISKVPTFSLKNLSIKSIYRTWFILGISIISIGLISNIWLTVLAALLIYIMSVFYTIITNLKK